MSDIEDSVHIEDGDRLSSLLSLCPRYIVVPPNPPDGIAFAMTGDCQDWDQLTYWHSGISNCKPGIWKAEIRSIPGAQCGDADYEACLRWVADLDDDTELDFGASLDEWQAWEQMFKDRFDGFLEWDSGIIWKHGGTYYDDGGIFNVISTAYLTHEAAAKVLGDDFNEDEYDGYLEMITLNDNPINEEDGQRNYGFTLGGLHFGQDSIGGPPAIALAEKDGRVVAIKLWSDDAEIEEGTALEKQPGRLVF
ncbi:hypothetical protein MKX07_007904 [Trichoderma sp. CBMAI-0711]|uniref:Uncharacterized protein n=1 Tax=Trichoderma parareesei TaxID=858221 RepID=A0A2H2Z0F0_TRIPA|nr:hypothetical protein MKX07_007904 [Trichoderma sp. CBMAI-0711]OTA01449.1 hypothetical protein A9Z42_0017970 [Trichoderma parareesei]